MRYLEFSFNSHSSIWRFIIKFRVAFYSCSPEFVSFSLSLAFTYAVHLLWNIIKIPRFPSFLHAKFSLYTFTKIRTEYFLQNIFPFETAGSNYFISKYSCTQREKNSFCNTISFNFFLYIGVKRLYLVSFVHKRMRKVFLYPIHHNSCQNHIFTEFIHRCILYLFFLWLRSCEILSHFLTSKKIVKFFSGNSHLRIFLHWIFSSAITFLQL